MSTDPVHSTVQHLAAMTGFSRRDLLDAVDALKSDDPLAEPWPDETIARALPELAGMAATGGASLRSVAAAARASASPVRPASSEEKER